MFATVIVLICLILLALLAFFLLFTSISMMVSVFAGAPLVNSPASIFPSVLELANLQKGELIVELGCGAGHLLAAASKTGAQVRGIDVSPLAYLLSRWNLRGKRNATVVLGSIFDQPLGDADVVYCYLLSPLMQRLEQKFASELKPGARVVSYAFALPTKKPTTVIPRRGGYGRVFLYTY